MLVHIPNLLDAATLCEVDRLIVTLQWGPGSATAGWHAREVKANSQALAGPGLDQLRAIVTGALAKNPIVAALALPRRIFPPLLSRTGVGQEYGTHVDDAFMGGGLGLRSDVSVTVFLNDPEDYRGGELVVETVAGEDAAKFGAGDAVLYPSNRLHRVAPVAAGERFVAVTWIESRVRDEGKREILFDLDRSRRRIFEQEGKSETFDLISKSYSNLLRLWGET